MTVKSCIPIIPSSNLERSLVLWRDILEFDIDSEMKDGSRLKFCMLRKGNLWFMLNQTADDGGVNKCCEGVRLYWAPIDLMGLREKLKDAGFDVSEIWERDYGRKEFFMTDWDGVSHCFGVSSTT
jgi:hypothetical protein